MQDLDGQCAIRNGPELEMMCQQSPSISLNCELNKERAALIRLSMRSLPFNNNTPSSLRFFIRQSLSSLIGDLSEIITGLTLESPDAILVTPMKYFNQ